MPFFVPQLARMSRSLAAALGALVGPEVVARLRQDVRVETAGDCIRQMGTLFAPWCESHFPAEEFS